MKKGLSSVSLIFAYGPSFTLVGYHILSAEKKATIPVAVICIAVV